MTTEQEKLLEEIRKRSEYPFVRAMNHSDSLQLLYASWTDRITLLSIIQEQRKALEFYGDKKNWQEYPVSGYKSLMKDHCAEGYKVAQKALNFIPGKVE